MNKYTLSILSLSALVLASCSTTKQDEVQPNKRELIERVLDQSKAPEIIPAAFFHHFPDKFGPKAVE